MSDFWRNLISRGVLLAVAAGLLIASYHTFVHAIELHRDAAERRAQMTYSRYYRRPPSGAFLVGSIGVFLAGGGLLCALGGLAPHWMIEKILHPKPPKLFDNPEPGTGPHRF